MNHERVRMLWPDHLGLARGKYVPAAFAGDGTGHAAAVFSLAYDRSFIPAPGSGVLDGFPDIHATFEESDLRPGWDDDRTQVAVCDLSQHGEPFRYSARYALRKAVADWEAVGYRPMVGIEFEAHVLERTQEHGWQRWDTPESYVYGTGRFVDPIGLMDEIADLAAASEIVLESVNAEFDSGQFELTLRYGEALCAADDAFLFRVLARECAMRHDRRLTFLGKPYAQLEGNGVHVNFSLVNSDGDNVLHDPLAADGLSALAKSCLAGLCAHHQALTPLCAPTVNAYRRLQPFTFSGRRANWGYDHRVVGTRVPPERGSRTRIESRLADGACNVHTAVAAVLQAARLGVVGGLDCPEPETNDGMEAWNTEVTSAPDLAAALDHLRADEDLAAAVSSDLVENFLAIKDAEWERYVAAVGEPSDEISEWEISEYLPYH